MLNIANVPIQGEEILLQISDDNEENYYVLVCLIKAGNKRDRPIKKTQTQCGEVVGKGVVSRTLDFEAAMNVIADDVVDNVGYASLKKLQTWFKDGTALIVRQLVPTGDGASFTNKSPAYLSTLNDDEPVDDVMTFNGTFTMFGTWTIT